MGYRIDDFFEDKLANSASLSNLLDNLKQNDNSGRWHLDLIRAIYYQYTEQNDGEGLGNLIGHLIPDDYNYYLLLHSQYLNKTESVGTLPDNYKLIIQNLVDQDED